MLSLNEHVEINETVVQLLEGELTSFSEEQIEAAEFYQLKWNPVTCDTILYLYDEAGQGLGSLEFEDAEYAIAYIEELFELDDDEIAELESYDWANEDNFNDRVDAALADDGTSD